MTSPPKNENATRQGGALRTDDDKRKSISTASAVQRERVPYSDTIERRLVGAAILFPNAVLPNLGDLTPDSFFDSGCASVFGAIMQLHRHGDSINVEAVYNLALRDRRLWTGNRRTTAGTVIWLLADCMEQCQPSDSENASALASIVHSFSTLREAA